MKRHSSHVIATGLVWLSVYLTLVLAPLFALLLGPTPPGLGFWWDLSMALGFAGLAMMGIQFVLTARFRRATAPFGIDIIYYFHRYIGIVLQEHPFSFSSSPGGRLEFHDQGTGRLHTHHRQRAARCGGVR